MHDIEIAPNTNQPEQGLAGRLRNLFTRNEPPSAPINTPGQRRRQMEIEAKDDSPLTGKHPLPVRPVTPDQAAIEDRALFNASASNVESRSATSFAQSMSEEELDAAVQHDIEVFNSPHEPDSPEIEAAVRHDYEISQELRRDPSTYSGNTSDQASLTSLAQQIHVQHEPIDPELSDTYYDEKDSGLPPSIKAKVDPAVARLDAQLDARAGLQQPGQPTDLHVCGPNCNCAASSGSRKQGLQQALIELAAVQGAEHMTDATGNAVLTGADADAILRAVQVQAAAAAVQKALRDHQRRAELEDSSLDQNKQVSGKEPIALKLTEEQVQLLVSDEYPNEPEKASQSVYKLIRDGEPVNILKESVQLDYSEDIKGFYARLDEAERPALLSKIQDLEKQDEREKRAPEQQRQRARSKDRERE